MLNHDRRAAEEPKYAVNSITRSFEVMEVTAPPAAPVVSWAVLGRVIGGVLIIIAVILSVILVRKRRALRA